MQRPLSCFYHGVSLLFHVGDSSARESFAKSLSIADKLHNDTMACRALNGLGLYAYIIENNYYTAQRYYISALERIKKNGHERLQTGIYGNLAEMSLAQNDTAGLGYARMSYIMAKKINNYGAIAFGAYCIAAHYSLRRQYAKALMLVLREDRQARTDASIHAVYRNSAWDGARR